MTDKNPPANPDFVAALAALITRRQLTEAQSAALLGVPVFTLRTWCAGTRTPTAAALRLVDVLCMVEVMAPAILDSLTPAPVTLVPAKRGRKPAGQKAPL